MTLLSLRRISKRYGAVQALARVDLDVGPGEIVAIAGENGSGKSTLVKIVGGLVRPQDGEILLDGEPCEFGRPRDALDRGISLVTQEVTAVPQLSIACWAPSRVTITDGVLRR